MWSVRSPSHRGRTAGALFFIYQFLCALVVRPRWEGGWSPPRKERSEKKGESVWNHTGK